MLIGHLVYNSDNSGGIKLYSDFRSEIVMQCFEYCQLVFKILHYMDHTRRGCGIVPLIPLTSANECNNSLEYFIDDYKI